MILAEHVGVVGMGTMGAGIAITSLLAGHDTTVVEVSEERISYGRQSIEAFLAGSVRRGKLTPDRRQEALGRLTTSTALEELSDVGFVIEAIVEDLEAKQELFSRLDDICPPEAVFASNTSTLSVTEIAAGSRRPERVVGAHFANPAPLMKLVEVAKGYVTNDESHHKTVDFIKSLGKTSVACRDTPGFILNLLLVPFENDCVRALESARGTVGAIDIAVTKGLGYPMGPFTLLDIVGLDVHHAVSMSLYEQTGNPRAAPPPLVRRMIAAGHLGRKTGRGFYKYEEAGVFGQ